MPFWCQAITWTKVDLWSIWPLGTKFSEILMEIKTFSLTNLHSKMSSAKVVAILSRPHCVNQINTPLKRSWYPIYSSHSARHSGKPDPHSILRASVDNVKLPFTFQCHFPQIIRPPHRQSETLTCQQRWCWLNQMGDLWCLYTTSPPNTHNRHHIAHLSEHEIGVYSMSSKSVVCHILLLINCMTIQNWKPRLLLICIHTPSLWAWQDISMG